MNEPKVDAKAERPQIAAPTSKFSPVKGKRTVNMDRKLISTNRTIARRAGDFRRNPKVERSSWPYPPEMTSADRKQWRAARLKTMQDQAYNKWQERWPDMSAFVTEVLADLHKHYPKQRLSATVEEREHRAPRVIVNVAAETTKPELGAIRTYLRQQSKTKWFPIWFKVELMVF